ncbi:MAG: hypothetical protein LC745_11750, partial [Planctomycetia bacterium]|nr:hypothetical protein [Planctomycetia bacterium]
MTTTTPWDGLRRLAGFAGIGVGALVLLAWSIGVPNLNRVALGFVAMKANSAVALVLSGVALGGLGGGTSLSPARRSAAGLAALIGALTLAEHLFGVDLRIDQVLFRDTAGLVETFAPGRMALSTSVCFLSLGAALALSDARTGPGVGVSQACALVTILLAMLSLHGFAFGVERLYRIGPYSALPVHTALTLVVLGAGTLLARTDRGLMRTVTADDVGGRLLRRLLPLTVLVPLALGGLEAAGERSGWY